MATYLFEDIAGFKSFIGGGANVSLELASIAPAMLSAYENHLEDWLDAGTWADLVDGVANDNLTQEETALIPYVRRPLAMLTMYEYAKIGSVQFSEAGMFRTETEQMKSPFKYQENSYREFMLLNGYEAIERMIAFLDSNRTDYSTWAASSAGDRARALVINNAREFREVYAKNVSRYTFEILRPLIADIEAWALIPLMGQEQFDRLKEGILAGAGDPDELTEKETALLKRVRSSVAAFTIEEGLRRHWVTFKADRVVQVEGLEPQTYMKEGVPATSTLDLRMQQDKEFANRHLSYVKKYLDDNAEDFPLYQAYLDELAAAEEATLTEEEQLCAERDATYPPLCCSYHPGCGCVSSCSVDKPKGLIRF